MHRLSSALRRSGLAFNRQLNEEIESIGIIFTRNLRIYRALQKEKDNGESTSATKEMDAKPMKDPGERSKQAKTKLDDLLKLIVQEQNASGGGKLSMSASVDMKLAAPKKEKQPIHQKSQATDNESKETENELGVEMVSAVKQVAESIDGNAQIVESELIQKLKTQGVGKKINLSDLFAGMQIDRSSKPHSHSTGNLDLSRAHRVRKLLDERVRDSKKVDMAGTPPRQRRVQLSKPTYVPMDLFGAPLLGIFSAKSGAEGKDDPEPKPKVNKLETWDLLTARDLKLSITHPPANGFEEMILWTEQGKLWKFPINNEQGFDEEAKVPFHEHVFLEPLIDEWCPNKGPVRHFMELVCVGLSKNPFISVQEKRKQIEWYHQYFKEKAFIIKDVGAGEIK